MDERGSTEDQTSSETHGSAQSEEKMRNYALKTWPNRSVLGRSFRRGPGTDRNKTAGTVQTNRHAPQCSRCVKNQASHVTQFPITQQSGTQI